jgi:hypothetical protein
VKLPTLVLLLAVADIALAQPRFDSPSPVAGSGISRETNEAADRAAYRPVPYTNAAKPGPALVVLPGEIRAADAAIMQRVLPNNIADYAELELSRANFQVLERAMLGPLLNEFTLAYNLGNPESARKFLKQGRLRSTKYIVKFDVLKIENVAAAKRSFDGNTLGQVAGILGSFSGSLGGQRAGSVGQAVGGSVTSEQSAEVWLAGMRYRVLDAETTEQLAQGYVEEKMESGATSGGALGYNSARQGGIGMDTLIQRLIQRSVWEIDAKYK